MEFNLVLCDNIDWWDGVGGREVKEGWHVMGSWTPEAALPCQPVGPESHSSPRPRSWVCCQRLWGLC